MKIYNPFKKISKLERELKDSLLDLDDLKRENERLSGKLEYLRENKENHERGGRFKWIGQDIKESLIL